MQINHMAYEVSEVSLMTPHPEDETDADVEECMAVDNAGEGCPFIEVGECS